MTDLVGEIVLDVYRVDAPIGAGGMGTVYSGTDLALERPVAVKVLRSELMGDENARLRFEREATELIALRHPHIVRLLAVGRHGDTPLMVLDHLGGGTLEDRMSRAALSELGSGRWLTQVGEALAFLHARGLVHRDVKPANILFDESGNAYLADLGLLHLLEDGVSRLTDTGQILGSPAYMAPEQVRGEGVSALTDQYALATILYEIHAGCLPFTGSSTWEFVHAKTRTNPRSLAGIRPDLPRATCEAIMRGLAPKPRKRHQDCAALLSALASGPPPTSPVAKHASPRDSTEVGGLRTTMRRMAAGLRRRPLLAGGTLFALLAVALLVMPLLGDDSSGASLRDVQRGRPPAVSDAQRAAAARWGVPVTFRNSIGMYFVLIPEGSFDMGSPSDEPGRFVGEDLHRVTLTRPFYIQTTEVTNGQLRQMLEEHTSGSVQGYDLDADDQPAVEVTRDAALRFATLLSGADTAHTYRLPTEAEWEYAARAGSATAWWWGDAEGDLARAGNVGSRETREALQVQDASLRLRDGHVVTAPVASYLPSPWGLFDVYGNAAEWCSDLSGPYPGHAVTDPQGPTRRPDGNPWYCIRGGSWHGTPRIARSAARFYADAYAADYGYGVRLVCDLPDAPAK